jgi:hypothetical protein
MPVAAIHGRKAPEGWIRIGPTAYLDQQKPSDFPTDNAAGASILWGKDAHGRTFVSVRLQRTDVVGPTREFAVTLFKRYSGDSDSPWVLGGHPNLMGGLGLVDGKDGPFSGGVTQEGLLAFTALLEAGSLYLREWDWVDGTSSPVLVELV